MRSLTTRAIVALAIPAWLIACSDSPTDPSCVVNSVTITGAPTELQVDATVQLGATVDSDDCSPAPSVTWSTSNSGRATVSNTGLVTGVGAGSVTITATAGGKSGTATFDVELTPVASVRITPEEIVIGVGPAHTLTAEALDADDNVLVGRTVTWAVSGGAGATVAAGTGALTGVTAGQTATVTASVEGITDDIEVHVVRSRLGFLWNNTATPGPAPLELTNSYIYNSLGGALTVASGQTGVYAANFAGQDRLANEDEAYFMTAYSAPLGAYCTNAGWGDTEVTVYCYSAAGVLTNMRFTVAHVSSASFGGRFAFGWVSSGSESVEASQSYRYNPTGGDIFSTRNATGSYTVRFSGLGRKTAADREAVIVNTYGGSAAVCQPASWTTVGADLDVAVRCFTAAGADVDSPFSLMVVDGNRTGARLGLAHADQPASASYAPANSAVRPTGSVLVTRNGVGDYTVAFTGFYRSGDLAETFLISATGSAPGRCNINNWSNSGDAGTPTTVDVDCATPAGVAADLPFSIVALQ
jgi:hypothetical protein